MTEQAGQSLHTDGQVSDYFVIESHILSTRSADAYKAIDRSRNAGVCLWTLRHPLAVNSEAVSRFLGRMYSIAHTEPAVSDMTAYGVDPSGTAFAVFPHLDGHAIAAGHLEIAEAQRRFLGALRFIDALHRIDIACGDLCASSFWVNREGDMRFVGVMGSFDAEAVATSMMPPLETLPFLAPEQRSGAGASPASDVFALGVLGYNLLTHRFPYGEGPALLMTDFDQRNVKPVNAYLAVPPVWCAEIFLKSLNPDPAQRYHNAGEMLSAIDAAKQRVFNQANAPVKTGRGASLTTGPAPSLQSRKEYEEPTPEAEAEPAPVPSIMSQIAAPRSLRIALLVLFLVVALVVFVAPRHLLTGTKKEREQPNDLRAHRAAVGNEDLKQSIDVVSGSSGTIEALAAHLDKIASSDDPLAHDVLVRSATDAKAKDVRELSEKAIINRAHRLGLMRSAEQVKQWLRNLQSGSLPPSYAAMLQSLNTTLPIDARGTFLRQAYADNPGVALRLAVALGFDLDNLEDSQPIIAQLVGDSMKINDAAEYSALALVLGHPDLALLFSDDAIQRREKLRDSDLLWLLQLLADRNDINARPIANLAIERHVVSPLRMTFLITLRDRGDLDPEIISALVRGARGEFKIEDMGVFGRWFDLEAEKILLAACADVSDAAVLNEAFDTLSGKSLTIEPSAALVNWIRKNYWEKRFELAHAIGILGNIKVVSDDDVQAALGAFDSYVKDSSLVDLFLKSGNPILVRTVTVRYPDKLGVASLLNLLDDSDKNVRLAAIRGLKSFNDIGALKMILDHYEKEKDPEVRELYKDTFWMIKQREERSAGGVEPRNNP